MRLINKIELWFETFTIVLPLKDLDGLLFLFGILLSFIWDVLRKKNLPLKNSLKRGLIGCSFV